MDTTRFDAAARLFGGSVTRREALRSLAAGAASLATVGILTGEDTEARKKRRKKKCNNKKKRKKKDNVCKGLNWCVDRSQTCGPSDGDGKCLVKASGGNVCAEILYQVKSCADCEAPSCVNCRCVLAAGGGDRCNNGVTGHDFICARPV